MSAEPGKSRVLKSVGNIPSREVYGLATRGTNSILVELERNDEPSGVPPVQQHLASLLSAPVKDKDVTHHNNVLVESFRIATGFDRVMIYRFREDWSGEVIAETASTAFGSYLGLRFPASDIPAIARNLYLINPWRLIPSVNADPVAVLGENLQPPDLTWSVLRSVSPLHQEYLNNMGVCASFSVPIRVAGRLWGLVACHHNIPRRVSPEQRTVCTSLANAYSLSISSYYICQRLQAADSLDRRIEQFQETLAQHDDPLEGIHQLGNRLMDAMSAQGFAIAAKSRVFTSGSTPEFDSMVTVDDWFLTESQEPTVITDHLEEIFAGDDRLLAMASGMIAIKARSPRSGWVRLYWFRPAEPQEVAWAGMPNKPKAEWSGAEILSPRRSFEKWVDVKFGYSRPWNGEEKIIAAKIRSIIPHWL